MSQLVVQKYGGSSLADADRIRHVARRIARERAAGSDLVVVVSAMGDTTDHLLELAARITDDPDPREMDLLLATGEHMSGTLVAMALQSLGVPAISLTGAQAGIRTDSSHGRARIANVDPARVQDELGGGQGRDRGRASRAPPTSPTGRARSPRSVAAARTPRPWRWPRAWAPTAARSTPTSRASSRPTRAWCRTPGCCPSSATRRCSSWPTRAPR